MFHGSIRSAVKLRSLVLAIAAGLWLASAVGSPARAELYRWTDENGTEHFTSDPGQVPVRYRNQAPAPDAGGTPAVNFVSGDEKADQARKQRLEELRARHQTTPPAQPSNQSDDAGAAKKPSAQAKPQKYLRDCSNAYRTGRCRSRVNPAWKSSKQDQSADDSDD